MIYFDSNPDSFNDITNRDITKRHQQDVKGRCAMARLDSSYSPRGNPCAQCGKPIPRPDWVESSPGRTSFLWFCRACDYRFEAVAIYEEADPDALAA
jgi:formamidopyrimidine-DNA glycosylase